MDLHENSVTNLECDKFNPSTIRAHQELGEFLVHRGWIEAKDSHGNQWFHPDELEILPTSRNSLHANHRAEERDDPTLSESDTEKPGTARPVGL